MALELDTRTVLLIQQEFGNHSCCVCGHKAQRARLKTRKGGDIYYCADCYQETTDKRARQLEKQVKLVEAKCHFNNGLNGSYTRVKDKV